MLDAVKPGGTKAQYLQTCSEPVCNHVRAKVSIISINCLLLYQQQFVLSLRRKAWRKVGTTQGAMLPNGKAPGLKPGDSQCHRK